MSFRRDFLRDLAIFLPLLLFAVGVAGVQSALAQGYLPIPEQLCGPFPCPAGNTGVDIAKSLAARIVDNVRYVIGAVAILLITVSGVKLVTAQGNEEVLTKETRTLIYGVVGLFFVGLAGEIAQIFEVDRGGFLKDPNVAIQKSRLFNRTLKIGITFIKYLIGSASVLYIIRSAMRMTLQGGTEDEITKDKKNLFYGMLGLVIILLSSPVINEVFFKIDTNQYPGLKAVRPGVDAKKLVQEIAGITNVVAAIAGPFALLSLVAGGLMYTLSGGEDEKINKAKMIIKWSIFGLVVIYGAFAIVSTFIARQFTGI